MNFNDNWVLKSKCHFRVSPPDWENSIPFPHNQWYRGFGRKKTTSNKSPFRILFPYIFPRSLKTSTQSLEERGRSLDFSQSSFFHCSRTPLDFRHPWPACTKRGKGKGEERRFLMIDKWVHLIKEIRFSQSSAATLHYSSQLCFFNPLQQISRRGEQRFGGDTLSLFEHACIHLNTCVSERSRT